MTYEEFRKGILIYIDREFVNKLHTGDWRKWAIPLASKFVGPALDKKYEEFLPMLKAATIVDENGCIDLEALYSNLKQTSIEQGAISYNLPLLGETTFNTADVESLYNIIKSIAPQSSTPSSISPTITPSPIPQIYTPMN